jgi:glyoxylate reductase
LKIVANCAVGYNNIDIEFAQERGIMVTNTPGILTETTADLTWALILATARRLPAADMFVREKKFTGWELDLFLGQEVTGKRLGIVGMGRIGKAVALRAQGFRMETSYFDPKRLGEEEEKRLKAVYLPLPELLSSSDIISLHTTLTEQTVHLISYNEFEQMKNTAIIINVSRGPVIYEKALVAALETGQIWGAGLDVFEHEPLVEEKLLSLPNVVLLPHIGSASYETRLQMALIAATNLVAGVFGGTPPNLV